MWSRMTTRKGADPGTVFARAGAAGTMPASATRLKTSRRRRRSIVRPDSLTCATVIVEVTSALLDPTGPPDDRRDAPGEEEQADDRIAEPVDVEPRCPDDELKQLGAADAERDRHRERRDGDVVVDLPNRVGERPAVRVAHERAVGGVEQRHSGREEQRKGKHGGERKIPAGGAGGQREQTHPAGGVEPEPAEHPE